MSYAHALLLSRAALSKGAVTEQSIADAIARVPPTPGRWAKPPRRYAPPELVRCAPSACTVEARLPDGHERFVAFDAGVSAFGEHVVRVAAEHVARAYPHAPAGVWRYWIGSGQSALREVTDPGADDGRGDLVPWIQAGPGRR